MLIRYDTLTRWNGEALNGIRHPSNIETLWTVAELAAVGLAKPVPFAVPSGKVISGPPSYSVDGANNIIETYPVQDAPPPSAEETRVASFEAEADRNDLFNRLKTATPAQINSWLTANMTNIAQARAIMAAIIKHMVTKGP